MIYELNIFRHPQVIRFTFDSLKDVGIAIKVAEEEGDKLSRDLQYMVFAQLTDKELRIVDGAELLASVSE